MKLRNQLLALVCLLVFVALGVLYFQVWVVQKRFGIIVFVSDGMVTRHLTAARLYEGGAEHRLALDDFPHTALVANSARDFAVPDAAAASTALATGVKVNHHNLSIDGRGQPLRTLLEIAKAQGRSVGLVTNGQLTDPAAAAFYAHLADGRDEAASATQFTEQAALDVALGGGSAEFLPETKNGRRKDGRDLLAELQRNGREMVWTKADLENASVYREGGIVGVFSGGPLAFSDAIESGSQQPSLADMVRRAIQFLEVNRKGYLLIVEAGLVTRAAERNEGERTINETLALDHAVATAVKYAGEKSLILAVGKHGIGGLTLNGYPLRQDHGVALLGTTASGYPSLTWATGPNGPPGTGNNQPVAFTTASALNTAEDVIAAGQGPGAEKLHGFMENTAIFELLRDAL
jgi:alkaline phosphatase